MSSALFFASILFISIHSSNAVVYSCDRTAACGCSTNPASITRIVGGEGAIVGSWGWMVSISLNNEDLCGGTIISSDWILTAAHCLVGYNPSQIYITAGSSTLHSGTQTPAVAQLIIHPNFDSTTYNNDIALIRLATPLNMNDPLISKICIPFISSETLSTREWPPSMTSVVAVGWGKLHENGPVSWTLQQVTLSTVDYRDSTCNVVIRNQYNQFCAGVYGGGKDTCQGDSGGPLMMFTTSNQWVLVGITSYGVGCARPTSAGVYTRVAVYENWIRSITNNAYQSVPFSSGYNILPAFTSILLSSLAICLFKLH